MQSAACDNLKLAAARRFRVPGECSERPCASGTRHRSRACPRSAVDDASRVNPTCADPAQESRSAIHSCRPGSRLSLRSPGTGRWRSRSGSRPRDAYSHCSHDVKQRSVVRSRGALLRPGSLFSFRVHPRRGGRSADRRTFLLSRVRDATYPRSVRRGASHDAGRSPLGAPPWRFSAGGRASISGISSGSVQRAPRSQVVMPGGRCPGPPESAVTSRGRRTPLPAPPSGSSPETPLHERGWQNVLYIRYVVKRYLRFVAVIPWAMARVHGNGYP